MEGKKRKGVSNAAAERPNKIVRVTFNENTNSPTVVSSPGLKAPRIAYKAYAKARSSKNSTDDIIKPSTHKILLHSSEHPRLDYTATPSTLDQDSSHYIAIFDPAKNELQITPAHNLGLSSTLRSETVQEAKKPRRTIGQQREALGREFGTKKAKKALDDRTVNALVGRGDKQTITSDVQSAILDSMSAPASAAALDENAALEASLASKPIPKPNLEAETVEEVYDINSLMPPQDAKLVAVKDWQEKTKVQANIEASRRFVVSRVQAIGERDDVLRLKALGYLNCLLDFHAALATAGKGKKVPKKEIMDRKMSSWPEALVSSIRRRFASPSNDFPQFQLQNLYTHMCALALYIDGFETDTRDLREDLKLEQKEIVQYFRELGCKITAPTDKERSDRKILKAEASSIKMAKLKLPLDFPKVRTGRRR